MPCRLVAARTGLAAPCERQAAGSRLRAGHHGRARRHGDAEFLRSGRPPGGLPAGPEGRLVDCRRVEELAGLQRISLRTGCFCNPRAGETAEHITEDDIEAAIAT